MLCVANAGKGPKSRFINTEIKINTKFGNIARDTCKNKSLPVDTAYSTKKCEYITVVAQLLQRREFYHYEAEKENAWKLIHLEISLYSLGTPPSDIDKVDH
jgi:hypothetical protein